MSSETLSSKPRRRWRRLVTGFLAFSMFSVAGSAWWNRRWIDPRFVGAWRVTHSKWDGQWIIVLNDDGSALWLERQTDADEWWDRGSAFPNHWSVGRDGFLLDNLDSPGSQMSAWILSLGGLLDGGKPVPPRLFRNRSDEITSVTDNQIRLKVPQPGILIPTILTLDRLDPKDVPAAKR